MEEKHKTIWERRKNCWSVTRMDFKLVKYLKLLVILKYKICINYFNEIKILTNLLLYAINFIIVQIDSW